MPIIAVLTNLPDSGSAFNLARELVTMRLAACVNVLSPVTSVYRWKGNLEEAGEVPVLIKSTSENYPAIESAIRRAHPYELPEIVSWTIERGLPDYLAWVERESSPE